MHVVNVPFLQVLSHRKYILDGAVASTFLSFLHHNMFFRLGVSTSTLGPSKC